MLILSLLNITDHTYSPTIHPGFKPNITKTAVNSIILPQIPHPFYFEFSFTLYPHKIPTYDGWVLNS